MSQPSSEHRVDLATFVRALGALVRVLRGSTTNGETITALRASGDWASIEQEFHDRWAEGMPANQLDPWLYVRSITAVEFRYAIECLGDLTGKRVLDLGAGPGEAAILFASRQASVTSVDIAPKMVRWEDRLAKQYGVQDRVRVLVGSANQLPFRAGWFDCVFGGSVLHHVDLPKAVLEVARILSPSGKAVFVEPLAHNPVIEVYRSMARQVRTPTEKPLTFDEIEKMKSAFGRVAHEEFHLFTLFVFLWFFIVERIHPNSDRYWKRFVMRGAQYAGMFNVLYAVDRLVLKALPFLRRYCWATVIECSGAPERSSPSPADG